MSAAASTNHRQPLGLSVLLGLLAIVGAYSIDAFFPALRAMAREFHVTNLQAQQTLTVYMLPYAIMAIVHGSLSDALGRRQIVLIGLGLYALASLVCALAWSFPVLLFGRALQGLVAGAGQVVGRAVVRDRYSGVNAQRMMSVITMIFGVGPALAPVIGGWVHVWLGWRWVFGTMALYALILIALAWYQLPETHPPEKRAALHLGRMAQQTFRVTVHPEFLLLALMAGCGFLAVWVYIGAGPAVVMDHWLLSETQYAALTVPIIGGYVLAAYTSGKVAGRLPLAQQLRLGLGVLTVTTLAMVLLQFALRDPPVWAQQLLVCASAGGVQLVFPVVTLRMLDLFPHARGAASSAQSFFSLSLGALGMGVLAPMLSDSMRHLALFGAGTVSLSWLIWAAREYYVRALGASAPSSDQRPP